MFRKIIYHASAYITKITYGKLESKESSVRVKRILIVIAFVLFLFACTNVNIACKSYFLR